MGDLFDDLISLSLKSALVHVAKNILLAGTLSGITLWSGLVLGLPLYDLIIGTVFVLAMSLFALVQWDILQTRTGVRDKISTPTVLFSKNFKGPGIMVGFQDANLAQFPINFKVISISATLANPATLANMAAPQTDPRNLTTLGVKAGLTHFAQPIVLPNPFQGGPQTLEGICEFSFKYGRTNKLKYKSSYKKKILVNVDVNGQFISGIYKDLELDK